MSDRRPYRTELTPLEFLRRSAYVYPDKTAVVHGDRGYTYGEFELRVRRLAAGLVAAGVEPGDRVAFLSPNTPPLLEAHYGVPAAGAVLVAINTRLAAGEIAYILAHSGARYLFVDRALEALVDAEALTAAGVTVVRIDDTGAPDDPYEAFLAGAAGDDARTAAPPPLAPGPADEEDPISMNYTSGTTGRPKGVVYTHRGAYLNAIGELIEMEMTPGAVYLWTLPMFHCNGWCFTWAVTAVGGTHVCLREVDAGRIWRLIESEGVTHYCGAPTVQIMLVNDPAARPLAHSVRTMIAGRRPRPPCWSSCGRSTSRPSTPTASRRRTVPRPPARGTPTGTRARPRSRRRCSRARARGSSPPTSCASWTKRAGTSPATPPPWARS